MKRRYILRYIMMGFLLASLAIGGCGRKDLPISEQEVEEGNIQVNASSGSVSTLEVDKMFTDRDFQSDYEEKDCSLILLEDTGVSCSDNSVKINEREIKITQTGSYLIRGTLTNGYILVDVPKDDKVQLILDGVSISCEGMAPIYVKQGDKVFITSAKDSQNTLTNTGSFEAIDDNHVDAAIFSKSDLTLNGGGSLTISSREGHGIVSKDDLVFAGGEYHITAGMHGISGKDSVRISECVLDITCKEDGIHSGNDEDADKGYVYIAAGDITIFAEDDGIHAESKAIIGGGNIRITNSYEGIEAAVIEIAGGDISVLSKDDGINATAGSRKNMTDICIIISGGNLVVNAAGDGLDSNGALYISGGTVYVSGPENGGNGALDYNTIAEITGGTVIAAGSVGMDQNFSGGNQVSLRITSSQTHNAGELIEIKDNQGKILASYTPDKSYRSVIISTPDLQLGQDYTISMGTEKQEITPDQQIYGSSNDRMGGFGKFDGEEWMNRPGGGNREDRGEGFEKPNREDWGEGFEKPGREDWGNRPEKPEKKDM